MNALFATVIMAAGKGTRMKTQDKPKVMFEVNGRPMIEHVVDLAEHIGSDRIIAVVGFRKELVIEHLKSNAPDV
jgi:bifunctional N-acetylglucosamine-1-phosphate-uridyltransferase/glucosamine-1-phosphate-acetyltransferase GlmU-like protein